jgi:Tfp pilus assembly PilM family ATPase
MINSIYCSPTHLKLIVGDADSKIIKVHDYAEIPLPANGMINGIITDEEVMAQFLNGVADQYGFRKNYSYLVVDSSNIQVKTMEVPPLNDAKVLEFVKREYDPTGEKEAELVIDYTVLNSKMESGGVSILAVAVNKPMLQAYKSAFDGAGCDLRGIDIGVNCQIKLSKFVEQLRTATYILTQIDGRALTLTLFTNGNYVVSNKKRLMGEEGTPEWISEISDNISSMVQFNSANKGEMITTCYISGVDLEKVAAISGGLSFLQIDIRELDISNSVVISKVADDGTIFMPDKYLLNLGNILNK